MDNLPFHHPSMLQHIHLWSRLKFDLLKPSAKSSAGGSGMNPRNFPGGRADKRYRRMFQRKETARCQCN